MWFLVSKSVHNSNEKVESQTCLALTKRFEPKFVPRMTEREKIETDKQKQIA